MFSLKRTVKQLHKRLDRRLTGRKHPYTYIAIGDSTVEGIGASVSERTFAEVIFASVKGIKKRSVFYNLGKHGATTKDVIDSQLSRAVTLNPDLITISIGANDIRHRVRTSEFEKNLGKILRTLQSETTATIVINNLPDIATAPVLNRVVKAYSKVATIRFNKIIAKLANVHDCIYVDLYRQTHLFAARYPEAISSDGFHPSDFGYALWANTIITTMYDKVFVTKRRFFWN